MYIHIGAHPLKFKQQYLGPQTCPILATAWTILERSRGLGALSPVEELQNSEFGV